MTEQEWLTGHDPIPMLHAKGLGLENITNRRWRLFSTGCMRMIWDHLPVESRKAVIAVEEYALGRASPDLFDEFIPASAVPPASTAPHHSYGSFRSIVDWLAHMASPESPASFRELQAMVWRMAFVTEFERTDPQHVDGYGLNRAHDTCRAVQMMVASERAGVAPPDSSHPHHPWHAAFQSAIADVNVLTSDLLRCVVGNPFRPIVLEPSWQTSTVMGLLAGISNENAYDRLPILADALEEAGCEEWSLLNHCRYQGRHYVGCWAAHLPKPAPPSKTSSSWFS